MDSSISYDLDPGDYTADRAIYPSTDSWRAAGESVNFTAKRRRIEPTELNDTFGNWIPVPDDGESLGVHGYSDSDSESDDLDPATGLKRKRYRTSDDPDRVWCELKQMFLDKTVRCDGLGDSLGAVACRCCPEVAEGNVPPVPEQLFKCNDCGDFLQCKACVISWHTVQPLHVLKKWTGEFWDDITIDELDVVYQVGHGASTIDPATCATFEALELYRLLNVMGNINVHDFVRMLERRTNPTKVKPIPDRYKAFGRMTRQYAFLKQAKRAGRAHDILGLDATPPGGFLYMLLLAVDANFRLKNIIRKNEVYNPSFGSGWGHLVEEKPYKKHLKNYVAEKDVSTCIVFAALLQKDTQMTTGLRCSGVGGVVCVRHELVRSQGMGDLQKGEWGTLARKLVVAIEERDIQIAAFTTVNGSLRTALCTEWMEKINTWKADKTKPNPYQPAGGKRKQQGGGAPPQFRAEAQDVPRPSGKTYAGSVAGFGGGGGGPGSESAPINPENVTLWMPSELKGTARTRGCVKGLAEKEAKLREAQCSNALDDLRRRLHAKRHFIQFRNSNVVGQRQATRSNTLIAQVGEHIETITAKYCRGWKALTALKGKTYCEKKRFFELKPEDIALDEEEEKKRTKKKLFPWIWTARGGPGEDELELHEGEAPDMAHHRRSADRLLVAVRVDWSKALARKVHWMEEVQLLREEMRRVMHSLEWKANWWETQQEARGTQIPAVLRVGLAAYAARQAHLHRQVAARFKTGWDTSAAGVVWAAARKDALAEGMASFARTTEES
ncbi:hypothetical protein B0H17DRAFT_1128104 [Mycena rosella]|uniref:CxC2-like cysteine cluster KDZ transposase-associated domain-containing protein n=1 Tax=Mycena rosella TaxID=1033263 RepID=A0AAD7DY94_MYCRO|nr:hypothetical protein B0H17DRAFT_1128104 [Mycena rosella]